MQTPFHRNRFSTACLCAGALLLTTWLVPTMTGRVLARLTLARFQSQHAETASWAPGRVAVYRKALLSAVAPPVAVLRIPSAGMTVPVLEGTSDLVLNRGAGHIGGTAAPGSEGNSVLAAHRDGFFRHLKDVAVGDSMELEHDGTSDTYRVESLRVVERGDTSMLRGSNTARLTLVTCYPFFFLGPAPQRYVVTATRVSPSLHARLQ